MGNFTASKDALGICAGGEGKRGGLVSESVLREGWGV